METRLLNVSEVPTLTGTSVKNAIKAALFAGRREAQLGKAVGLTQFGVNLVTLDPGSISSLRHWHEGEDEFVYVLSGALILIDENGEHAMSEGSVVGFPAGVPNAHHIANRSDAPASFLVAGTRKVGRETLHYPDDGFGPVSVERDAKGDRI